MCRWLHPSCPLRRWSVKCGRVLDQGSRRATHLLRFPRRAPGKYRAALGLNIHPGLLNLLRTAMSPIAAAMGRRSRLNEALDLALSQMLTGPIGGVGFPHRQSNCAFLRWPARPLSDARMTAISCPAFARAFLAVFGLVSARSAPAGRQECARYATSTGEMGFGDQFVAMSATGRVNAN